MNGSDRIVSMLYINKTLLHPSPTIFVQGNQYPNRLNILRREYLISHLSKKSLEEMKLSVTRFRQSFHCISRIWKLILKITKIIVPGKITLIIGSAMMGSEKYLNEP